MMFAKKMNSLEVTKRRILVVDDESNVRDAIQMLLTYDGHDVETAKNGLEALAIIKVAKFDLVLTDYAMPAMTGEELAAAIKALLPKQPVGMITAYADLLRGSGNPLLGVDFLLSKPFGLTDLRAAVARVVPGENN